MTEQIQAIRGMSDLLPAAAAAWSRVEELLRAVFRAYGYREIRVPVLERTELFRRSIGEVTDVVEKEMYTFDDRNGVSLTLRPEATAGIVRATIENGMLRNQRHKLWCAGPMFRYEKPPQPRCPLLRRPASCRPDALARVHPGRPEPRTRQVHRVAG